MWSEEVAACMLAGPKWCDEARSKSKSSVMEMTTETKVLIDAIQRQEPPDKASEQPKP